jgi:hypothetical protein
VLKVPAINKIERAADEISSRLLSDGGFPMLPGHNFRPDATAWAILAQKALGNNMKIAESACRRLARSQQQDGRVTIIEKYFPGFWPTPLSTIAWKCIGGFESELKLGVNFLLAASGDHWEKKSDSPSKHDTSIRGWSWTENTYSWVEPTSMAILALKACGYSDHPRVTEAVSMILDRQLPSGGWNYGNKEVFERELLPSPVNTGQALCALGGLTEQKHVDKSLKYLNGVIDSIKTPMALAWVLFGMGEWGALPAEWPRLVDKSLFLQNRYGVYDTVLLSQLVVASVTKGNLLAVCQV